MSQYDVPFFNEREIQFHVYLRNPGNILTGLIKEFFNHFLRFNLEKNAKDADVLLFQNMVSGNTAAKMLLEAGTIGWRSCNLQASMVKLSELGRKGT